MTRRGIRSTFFALALAALIAASGCGGDDDSSDNGAESAKTATAPDPEAAAKAESRRRAEADAKRKGRKKDPSDGKTDTGPTDEELRRERQRDREEDRKFDEQFKENPFDKLIARLPIRKPPLYVEQYITTDKSHTVHTAVDRKRFFCRMTRRERKKAVADFYRAADKAMRSGGVKDFVQVVTVTAETTEKLPALATARNGSVSLTKLGRGKGPC